MKQLRILNTVSSSSLLALIFLCLAWELWLAPLRPGGSALIFKVFPLLIPVFGVLRGSRYTHQWASMMILLYAAEGLIRIASDPGQGRWLAGTEILLSTIFYVSAVAYARFSAPSYTSP